MRILLLPSSPRDSEHRDGRKEERKCCSLCSPYAHSPAPLVSERFRTSRRPQRKKRVFFLVFSLCAFSCSPRLREIPNIETAAKRKGSVVPCVLLMRILLLRSSPKDSEHRDGRKGKTKCFSLCSPYAHSPV